jgi:hypothetical protein
MRALFGLCVALASCRTAPPVEPRVYRDSEAPAELGVAVERADAALLALRTRLLETLTTEISKGGPASAVDVCRDVAQEIAATAARESGVDLGRTSDRLRNPENAPREWAREIVAENAGTKAADASPHVVDLGDRVGVLRPIGVIEMCTACHGTDRTLDPQARARIAAAYPQDRATGFEIGDLRGWMWAETPK